MNNGKKALRAGLLTLGLLFLTSSGVNTLAGKPASDIPTIQLREVTVVAKSKAPTRKRITELHGFDVCKGLDGRISAKMDSVMLSYKGPKVLVTSLRRNWNKKSDHYHGNAVDFDFSHEMIMYLVSEEGKAWMLEHGLYFYIEGRPGSKKVAEYLKDPLTAPYVFFNPNAKGRSGNHIHLGLK